MIKHLSPLKTKNGNKCLNKNEILYKVYLIKTGDKSFAIF